MVKCVVEVLQLLIGQVGNVVWIAAGIDAIGGIGEQRLLDILVEHVIWRTVRALHLVVDHALVGQRLRGVFEFVMPAFLLEVMAGDARVEHGIEIHIDQIIKVLRVLRCHRVAGFIGIGKGIQKRLERTLDQLDKRVFQRVLTRTTQRNMLKNMRHASRIGRWRAEGDTKHLVLVVILD